jgi:hypothetical protein
MHQQSLNVPYRMVDSSSGERFQPTRWRMALPVPPSDNLHAFLLLRPRHRTVVTCWSGRKSTNYHSWQSRSREFAVGAATRFSLRRFVCSFFRLASGHLYRNGRQRRHLNVGRAPTERRSKRRLYCYGTRTYIYEVSKVAFWTVNYANYRIVVIVFNGRRRTAHAMGSRQIPL